MATSSLLGWAVGRPRGYLAICEVQRELPRILNPTYCHIAATQRVVENDNVRPIQPVGSARGARRARGSARRLELTPNLPTQYTQRPKYPKFKYPTPDPQNSARGSARRLELTPNLPTHYTQTPDYPISKCPTDRPTRAARLGKTT